MTSLDVLRTDVEGCVPLFVIVGLPDPTAARVREWLVRASLPGRGPLLPARYLAPRFPANGSIYRQSAVEASVRDAGDFVLRQRRDAKDPTTLAPSRFFLLYVRSHDEEVMLSWFDFFALSVPLDDVAESNTNNGHWRHDFKSALERVQCVIQAVNKRGHGEQELAARLLLSAKPTALLLPPQNFRVSADRSLADELRARRAKHRVEALLGLDDDIKPQRFEKRQLPNCPQIPGGAKVAYHQDSRGLVFPPDPTGHGPARELSDNPAPSALERRHVLRQLFRFGVPVPKSGYHHDAQLEAGRSLGGIGFDCAKQGVIYPKSSHVNVYPNDYVNVPKG